jgi:Glycosyl hydrolases family 16
VNDPPAASISIAGATYIAEGVDTFTKSAPIGSFASNNGDLIVYTGDHGMGWTEYADGLPSTNSGGAEGYQPSTVQSVHDGVLDFYLHNDSAGHPVGANPSPLPVGNRYQTYGVWMLCEQIVPDPNSDLGDFRQATLLWPPTDADYRLSESDFPENDLDQNNMAAYAHFGGAGAQDQFNTGVLNTQQWHLYTQTWGPGFRSFYVDGRLIGTSTNQVYASPERWQLQLEPSGRSDGGSGHLYIRWVWIGAPG